MPASRRARATTLAPRSWPSRPGLAIRTRMRRRGAADVLGSAIYFFFALDFREAVFFFAAGRRAAVVLRAAPAALRLAPDFVRAAAFFLTAPPAFFFFAA